MRTAHAKPCQRTPDGFSTGEFTLSISERGARLRPARGSPEPERGTPVNMENRLHRDNGEGVALRPLPYPLRGEGIFE